MSHYIKTLLELEITCIPQILRRYVGKYYNNALCNGVFWAFVIWSILHFTFDKCLNALFKKMNYKEYVRGRLKYSLWYLGFFTAALAYCGVILFGQEFDILNLYQLLVNAESSKTGPYVLGHVLLISFYAHSAVWEAVEGVDAFKVLSYTLLAIFVVLSYLLRTVEVTYSFVILISSAHVVTEMTKIVQTMCHNGMDISKNFMKGAFGCMIFFILSSSAINLLVIPLTTLIPFSLKLMEGFSLTTMVFVTTLLVCVAEMASSPCKGLIQHYLYHNHDGVDENSCPACVVECSLFAVRSDDLHRIRLMRQEIKKREEKMMSLRKPKNRNMLIQTIKCMVAIRRKLAQKRKSESSDSEDSDHSESESKEIPELTSGKYSLMKEDKENVSDSDSEDGECCEMEEKENEQPQELTGDANVIPSIVDDKLKLQVPEEIL